ncbi:MAG: hypothetical protein OXF65_13790 [Acidimicrobiaceae bacterium]|nr:hypothetical protein [Acidimicrobiaceae bacterium]
MRHHRAEEHLRSPSRQLHTHNTTLRDLSYDGPLSSRTATDATDLHEAIEKVEDEITTFGRFVQTRDVRPILGYDFEGSELVPTEGTSEATLYERLIGAVKDLAGGKDVNDLRSIPQRVAYAHLLAGSDPGSDEDETQTQEESAEDADESEERAAEQTAEDEQEETSEGEQEETSEGEQQEEPKQKRRKRTSQPRASVLEAPLPDAYKPRIVRISEELCDLNVHEKPNAVAVLLRLLIEMTTEQCRRQENLSKQGSLNDRIERVINRVQTSEDQQDNRFHGIKVSLQSPDDRDHTKNFNQHVHNVDYLPAPTDLINIAHNYSPYFERIAERLAQSP